MAQQGTQRQSKARNGKARHAMNTPAVIPDVQFVIPDSLFVIPAPDQVRGFNIRDPVARRHWIADQVRNDSRRPQ